MTTPGGEAPWPSLRIEPEARDFILRRGGAVTVRRSRRHGCCGGTVFVPTVEARKPDLPPTEGAADPNRLGYRSLELERVTVFLEDGFSPGSGPLVIGLEGVWGLQRLWLEATAFRT